MMSSPSAPLARTSAAPAWRSTLAAACLACLGAPVLAQTVVVTGSREPLPLDRVTADVVVIDADRIRSTPADSVEDLLRREAGLQLSRSGPAGQTAGVFIRGASSGNTVVLLDGVRLGSGTLGQVELEALSLAQVERIEVLRGPGSSLYGADAVGGVVQIFTRRGTPGLTLDARAAAGGYGGREGSLALRGGFGIVDLAASVSHERDTGVSSLKPNDTFGNYNPDRDGHRRTTAQLQLGVTPVEGQRIGLTVLDSRLRAQYDGTEFAPPDYLPDNTGDLRNRLDTRVVSLDWRGRWSGGWTTTLQAAHNDDDLVAGDRVRDRFRTRRDQFTAQAAWAPDADSQLVLAFEHLGEQADSTQYLGDRRRHNNAVVLGWSGRYGAHTLQADLRHDDNSAYGGNTTGRLGWGYDLSPSWRVRALAGTTYRAPSFNELYYPGYGVDTVGAERGRSIELGLHWRANGSEASATVYRNRLREMIGYTSDAALCPADPAYQYGCAHNIGRARLQGLTLAGGHRVGAWSLRGTIDFLDAKDSVTGARLTRRAAHQQTLSADYAAGAWSAGAAVVAVGARPEGGRTLGAYALLDLTARWRFAPDWQLEAKLLNATDRRWEPALDYQSLGRQGWLGLRYTARLL